MHLGFRHAAWPRPGSVVGQPHAERASCELLERDITARVPLEQFRDQRSAFGVDLDSPGRRVVPTREWPGSQTNRPLRRASFTLSRLAAFRSRMRDEVEHQRHDTACGSSNMWPASNTWASILGSSRGHTRAVSRQCPGRRGRADPGRKCSVIVHVARCHREQPRLVGQSPIMKIHVVAVKAARTAHDE
jgi:hypothetical protein